MKAFNLFLVFASVALITACGEVGQKFESDEVSLGLASVSDIACEPPMPPAQGYGEIARATLNIPSNGVADVPVTITVKGQGYPISVSSSPEALRFIDQLLASTDDPTKDYHLPIAIKYVLTREACTGLCLPGTEVFKVLVLNVGLPID